MRFAFLDATTPAKGNAALIRAVAIYLEDHGLINTTGCAIPRSGPHLLEALDEETRRAEASE